MALFHLLLECQKKEGLSFGVAHVDHGWRKESSDEAGQLEAICEEKNIPFHSSRLNPNDIKGNLEASCRLQRMEFFKSLCEQKGYFAVLLGHHLDDQAETVLKRVFEGARIEHCHGMSETNELDGILYWRPLLKVRKFEILDWLNKNNIHYFDDYTNHDTAFLRARIRDQMLPSISAQFGKEVEPGLAFIGSEASLLNDFISCHAQKWLSRVEVFEFGKILDLQDECPGHLFEARYLISEFFPEASRDIVYKAAHDLLHNCANKKYESRKYTLYVDRQRLILTSKKFPSSSLHETPLEKRGVAGVWTYKVVKNDSRDYPSNWKQILNGTVNHPIQEDLQGCVIGNPPKDSLAYKKLKRRRSQQKVPSFLKNVVPIIRKGESIICDFLESHRIENPEYSRYSIILEVQH